MSLDVLKANRIAGSVYIEPNETLYDPVSKMRVSNPSNLIDTDFEYGLQSSKWETLELINNIPTFFARDGSLSLSINTMTATQNSNIITVTSSEDHGLVVGNSIIVKGASIQFADGTYVVLTTPTSSTFTYRARRASPITGSVKEESTEIYLASLYQGTEFKLESLGAIATDGASPSTITVSTNSPHGFAVGTTFILLNSLTSQQIQFDARLVTSLVYSETQAITRTDDSVTPDNNDYQDQAYITYGTAGVTDPGSTGMTLVVDGDATTSNEGIDDAVLRVLFPESMAFKMFEATYDRLWVSTNGVVSLTNDTNLLNGGPFVDTLYGAAEALTPRIEFLKKDYRLKKLYYSTTTTSLRLRFEGKEFNDGQTSTTIIWELTFDCENDTIEARLIKADLIVSSLSSLTFKVIGPLNEAYGATVAGDAFYDPQRSWKRQLFIRTTSVAQSVASVNGYSANSLDLDNTSKFNPYVWTAEKANYNPASASRPSLFFGLGKNTAELWTKQGVNDSNYIVSTRFNVLTFDQPHYLQDNRPYLYNPGVLNGGLTIGGSVISAPTVYYVRTKPGFYNGTTTAGSAVTVTPNSYATACSVSGNTLTIGGTITSTFDVGTYIGDGTYADVPDGTYIVARGTGTGGAGTYIINRPLNIPSFACTGRRSVMTVTSTTGMYPGAAIRLTSVNTPTPFSSTHIQGPSVTAGSFIVGYQYTISSVGTTNFTLIGAANNNVGTTFTATGAGTGTGTANGSLGGLNGLQTYYVKDVLSATQITICTTKPSDVNDDELNVAMNFTQSANGTFTVQVGTIITDSSTQAVLVTQANRRTALAVNFGVQAAAARFPAATDRFGPHSFMAVSRVHDYQTAAGTMFVQCADTANNALLDNQPLAVWTTAIGGTTALTNNWTPSQLSSIVYARNPNSDSHTAQVTLPFGASNGSNTAPGNANFASYGTTDGAIGTVAAAVQDAATLTLTFDEGNFTTVTGTTVTTNIVTVQSTTGMKVGQVFQVDGSIGNLSANTDYYVLTIASATTLTLSTSRGGAVMAQVTASGRVPAKVFGPLLPVTSNVMESFLGALNVTTFATNTTAGTNVLTLTTTQGLAVNQPFTVGATFGNIVSGTTYYIKTIESGTDITLSSTQGGATTFVLTTASNAGAAFTATPLRNTPKGHEIVLRENAAIEAAYAVSPFGEYPQSTTYARGIVTSHTGTTTRSLTIKLINPLNNALALQTNNVGFSLYGSAQADILTFNLATAIGGSNLTLSGTAVDGYVVPINYTQPWSTGRTWYSRNHGFQNNDLVFWEASGGTQSASVPTGLTNKAYFIVDSATQDRFKLLSDAGAALAVTTAVGANLYTPELDYGTQTAPQTTKDTMTWLWKTAAVASGGTSQTITYPMPSWSTVANIVVPNITAGTNTFTFTSAARLAGGGLLNNVAHHGGRVRFYDQFNQPLKLGTPYGRNVAVTLGQKVFWRNNLYEVTVAGTTAAGPYAEPTHTSGAQTSGSAELTWIGDSRFNEYDIRIGGVSGVAPALSVVAYVLTPGGLPAPFTTTSTNKIIVDTGMSVRDEDQLVANSNWMQNTDNFIQHKDNAYYPHVGAQFVDLYEHSRIPSTTLKKGSITAVTAAENLSVTYTFPANTVNIASAVRVNNVATITTATPHGFKVGSQVNVAGVSNATFVNATAVIKQATYNTFSYDNAGTDATSLNGTASQLIPAIAPNVLTISAFTSNSTATVTTAAHGIAIGAVVPFHFQGIVGTDWGGLWDHNIFYAKATTTTAFEVYLDAEATEPLNTASFVAYNAGTNIGRIWFLGAKLHPVGNTHYFTKRVANTDSDTVYKATHGLTEGTAVTYATGTGNPIGGLTGGATKYVFSPTTDRFKLADTATGWSTAAASITQNVVNMTSATGVITTVAAHGFTTGRQVQYVSTTPPAGLTNGAFYYVRADSATTCTLYWTQLGAINNTADDRVKFVNGAGITGTGTLREALIVDFTSEGTGTDQTLTTGVTTGAVDGLYTVANAAPGGNTSKFTLNNPTGAVIPKRVLGINASANVDLYWNAIYSAGHKLVTGTPVVYTTTGTAIGPLVSGATYYIIKVTEDWFRLAATIADAVNPIVVPLNLNSGNILGSGNHQFEASSVVGSIQGAGTIALAAGTRKVVGNNTNFSTAFKSGDNFYWNYPAVYTSKTVTFAGGPTLFSSATHGMLTGMSVRWNSTVADPSGLVTGNIYYVRYNAAGDFYLHPTYNDAVNNTNPINASGGSGTHSVQLIEPGNTGVSLIDTVNSRTVLNLVDTIPINEQYKLPVTLVSATSASADITISFPMPCPFPVGSVIVLTGTGNATQIDNIPLTVKTNAGSNSTSIVVTMQTVAAATVTYPATTTAATVSGIFCYGFPATNTYDITSSLLLRADSSALHRPYDGGVELIATNSPNARVIRQTRKYFRYQSGKGIQVSFAINFSPSVPINTIVGNGNYYATVSTRVAHRASAGLSITITGDGNGFNGQYTIYDVIDDYSFRIQVSTPTNAVSTLRPQFYVNSWSDATVRCGLFDGQNGMYFEYDGSTLYVCRRNSTTQLGGTASVIFNSNAIIGTNTQFTTELASGDHVVIRGMTYKVIEVANNNTFYVQPAYRGATSNNVVISKTQEIRVPQSSWNLDTCDGTGPTGYTLDIHKIQMAYMDYSWYGAGKVRFGFKTTDGVVRYVHQIVHNNLETEAYLRSGNLPARYEVDTATNPTFIPKLAHWGTSVIMDGGFDDDKAYLFSATSNQIRTASATTTSSSINVTGGTTVSISQLKNAGTFIVGRSYQIAVAGNTTWTAIGAANNNVGTNFVATGAGSGNGQAYGLDKWYAYNSGGKLIGEIGYAIEIPTHSDAYYGINANSLVSGTGITAGTLTANPTSALVGSQPYIRAVRVSPTSTVTKNLLVVNAIPSSIQGTSTVYTVTQPVDLSKTIPLLSLRLSPSVDNGMPGKVGVREIINRMQLNLKALDVLSTHEIELSLVLNADLDNLDWKRVTAPSLSQVVYHNMSDTIDQGSVIFSFRVAPGGTNTTPTSARAQSLTSIDLREIATLGNAIMGGDGVFPDGPDVLTLRMRYIGLTADVSATSQFVTSCRLSWTESQA